MSISKLSAMSRQTIGALEEMDIVEMLGEPRRGIEVRPRSIRGSLPLSRSTTWTAAPAVPKCTRVPLESSGRWFGSRPQSVMSRAAMRQHVLDQRAGKAEPPVLAPHRPGAGHDLDPRGAARWQARSPPAPPAPRRGSAPSPSAVSGLYCPPAIPGRTGRSSSASGAARNATRAVRPPARRARAGALVSPTAVILTTPSFV